MKQPAFMFYPADFLIGCSDLTMEERGIYITLLSIQHQKGVLTEKSIGLILGYSWDMVSVDVRLKFEQNDKGEIYNNRLVREMEKRELFTAKQRENGSKGGRPRKNTEVLPEENKPKTKPKKNPNVNPKKSLLEDDNDNENKDINDKGVIGEKESLIEKFVNPELKMPDEFKIIWAEWIEYKKSKKSNFKYAGTKFEQMAVDKLLKFSGGNVETAREIIVKTFSSNYEGFFPLTTDYNKPTKKTTNAKLETNR